jgi:hypothetical protein
MSGYRGRVHQDEWRTEGHFTLGDAELVDRPKAIYPPGAYSPFRFVNVHGVCLHPERTISIGHGLFDGSVGPWCAVEALEPCSTGATQERPRGAGGADALGDPGTQASPTALNCPCDRVDI